MMQVLTFVGFWLVVTFVIAVGIGKWLKRQRLKHGGDEPWNEEWTK